MTMSLLTIPLLQTNFSLTPGGTGFLCRYKMVYIQRVILVLILGSELGVHTLEHQPVSRPATASYVL